MRHNPTIGGISSVQWWKVGISWRLQMYFCRLLCIKIKIDQLYCVNCWIIIYCLSVNCTKIKHSCYVLMIWSSLQLTSKWWINTQQFTARADLFFIIASFCSLEGRFESKIEGWKIRNSKTRCLAIRQIVTVSMLYQFPVDAQLICAFVFCMCKKAIQFVWDISLICSFFYMNIHLSIATQPSLCWTC